MSRWNIDLQGLLDAADCKDVADYIGLRTEKHGSHLFGECIDPDHHMRENHIEHMVIEKDHYYCYSCGARGNAVDLVQNFKRTYEGAECSFKEACQIVGDSCGGFELYTGASKADFIPFPFSKEEMAVIGIKENGEGDPVGPAVPRIGIRQIYKADPKACNALLRQMAKEAYDRYSGYVEEFYDSTELHHLVRTEWRKKMEICREVLERAGGKLDTGSSVPRLFRL